MFYLFTRRTSISIILHCCIICDILKCGNKLNFISIIGSFFFFNVKVTSVNILMFQFPVGTSDIALAADALISDG